MLSVERCQQILNDNAPPSVSYTRQEAERLRSVLYLIARIELDRPRHDEDADESPALYPRLYRRAG